ncbi:MAG: RNA-guided endonuclease IscB [Xenococcaceae cyanobacterium]
MFVFVLDKNKKPLSPCHPARARRLLSSGRASVFRRYPFTIIIHEKQLQTCQTQSHRLKIDPGAKTTGLAILQGNKVIWAAQLTHRGFQIRDALRARRQLRRSRRHRHTRYRKPRFLNRRRPEGWLAPSLMSRVHNIITWVKRLCRYCPIDSLSQELVRFDNHALINPEISGVQYQQGELFGYEVREYLLEKWKRKCAYCGATNTRLEVEHIYPKSKGGSNRISNLTLACRPCNQAKGHLEIEQFLSGKPNILKQILAQANKPLADAAAVNATRWKLSSMLKSTGLPVEIGSGGLTKYNRCRQELPKTHWLDAACVGKSTPEKLIVGVQKPLLISAKGHGARQSCRTNKYGFPIRHCSRHKIHKGFQTGDIVKAVVTKGKKIGTYVGRVATRATGSFNISTKCGLVQGISYKYCKPVQRKDGYAYHFQGD